MYAYVYIYIYIYIYVHVLFSNLSIYMYIHTYTHIQLCAVSPRAFRARPKSSSFGSWEWPRSYNNKLTMITTTTIRPMFCLTSSLLAWIMFSHVSFICPWMLCLASGAGNGRGPVNIYIYIYILHTYIYIYIYIYMYIYIPIYSRSYCCVRYVFLLVAKSWFVGSSTMTLFGLKVAAQLPLCQLCVLASCWICK